MLTRTRSAVLLASAIASSGCSPQASTVMADASGETSGPSSGQVEADEADAQTSTSSIGPCDKGAFAGEPAFVGTQDELEQMRGHTSIDIDAEFYLYGRDITSAEPLECLESVSYLLIGDTSLEDLSGLERLTDVRGLSVVSNPRLRSLVGLGPIVALDSVSIRGNPELSSLEGLDALVSVTREVEINDNGLTSLAGLGALTTAGHLSVVNEDRLSDLAGLGSLTSVVKLSLDGNARLESLAGLDQLESIGDPDQELWDAAAGEEADGLLRLKGNPVLSTLAGVPRLEFLHGIFLEDNPSLSSLTGLEGITRMHGLRLDRRSSGLVSTEGLSSLEVIDGDLVVDEAPDLVELVGFDSLTRIGGWSYLARSPNLAAVELPALVRVGPASVDRPYHPPYLLLYEHPALTTVTMPMLMEVHGEVEIALNPAYPTCQAQDLANQLEVSYAIEIEGNLPDACGG